MGFYVLAHSFDGPDKVLTIVRRADDGSFYSEEVYNKADPDKFHRFLWGLTDKTIHMHELNNILSYDL
jgi:hypothetical protein